MGNLRTPLLSWVFALTVVLLGLPDVTWADIQTRMIPVSYGKDKAGVEVIGECVLTWDDAAKAPRPGILVFPEWWGMTSYPKARARQLAELGYVAMVVDVYGGGKTSFDPVDAAEWSAKFKEDRGLLRLRATKALDVLRKLKEVDGKKVGAVGYCFGGLAALELARSGADLAGVVTFHGDLSQGDKEKVSKIKGRVLVCHGAVDPLVPAKVVDGFMAEMNAGGVDYEFIAYAGAVHAFTNPASGSDPAKGVAYNRLADERSWTHMKLFLTELFR